MNDEWVKAPKFLNRRTWAGYASALQSAVSYPKVFEALKSGRDWCAEGASQASGWLVGREPAKLGNEV